MGGVLVTPVKPNGWVFVDVNFTLVLEIYLGIPVVHWLKCRKSDVESAGLAVGDFLVNGPLSELIKMKQPRNIAVGAMILDEQVVDHLASTETAEQFIDSIISALPAVGLHLNYTAIAHSDPRVSLDYSEIHIALVFPGDSPAAEVLMDMCVLREAGYPAYCLCEINYFRSILSDE